MANRRKPIFSFISMIIIFTTFLISVNSQVSFNIDRFTSGDSRITLQGTASINNGNLALIDRQSPIYNTGRALYSSPVRIWDRNGNAASFVTSFSFVIQNVAGVRQAGDGLIFFLSPNLEIPTNSSGGKLGVVNPSDAFNNFVGVELDTFSDRWDPNFSHIGINVNSLYSVKIVRWDWIIGSLVTVSIVYDSPLKTLSVTVTSEYGQLFTVSQVVDLKTVLPQTVYIGLSATTSIARQLTDIHSWSFTSNFGRINNLLPIIAE